MEKTRTFTATIKEASRELSTVERIKLKDTADALSIDEVTAEGDKVITPVAYVILAIHNEKSDNKDYDNIVVIDKDGTKYVTGSVSFMNSFLDLWDELAPELAKGEEIPFKLLRRESKNFKGKDFLTCVLA